MSNSDEFAFMDAITQADLIRRKEVKPIELVEAAIERIERLNPTLNAVVTPMYEIARETATGQLPDGPFTGVPYLLKDLIAEYAGVRFTEGSAFLSDFVPDRDCELVTRLKKAGLIILGKTNTPEFGLQDTTEPHLFGPTHNPWDTSRTPGGSSGGSAAAVAAGLVSIAHGNDGGGSIRTPASCCGLFGLKPTRARNPLGPLFGDALSGLVVEHAITRSVRDSAALLDATSGPDFGDPYCAPPPSRPFLEDVGADPGCLKIAFTTHAPTGVNVHEDCINAVKDVAKVCLYLGHEVEEVEQLLKSEISFPWEGPDPFEPLDIMWCGYAAWVSEHWERRRGRRPGADSFEPMTWKLIQRGRNYSLGDYLLALEDIQRLTRNIAHSFIDYDLWLTPSLAEPPVPLGTFESTSEEPLRGWIRTGFFNAFTSIANITGQPAMSVPLNWNAEGLPIGTQFIGRFGDEATLFRLAAQLESARPWTHRRPPISVQ